MKEKQSKKELTLEMIFGKKDNILSKVKKIWYTKIVGFKKEKNKRRSRGIMAEKGLVVGLKNDLAVIRLNRIEACAKCRACVAGMKTEEMMVEAENECDAVVGDWVEMELRDYGFLKAVLIMYGLPLIGFMVGLCTGYFILSEFFPAINRDIVSASFGLIGTMLVFLWIRSQESRWSNKKYRPVATRVTTADEEE